jgi:hypothetical protein
MTREQIITARPEELNRLAATEIMGWTITIGESSHKGQVIAWPIADAGGIPWNSTKDHNHAFVVQAEIERRGFWMKFTLEIREIVAGPSFGPCTLMELWKCAHASPEARVRAALLAVLPTNEKRGE